MEESMYMVSVLWLLVLIHVGVICIRELGIPTVCKYTINIQYTSISG